MVRSYNGWAANTNPAHIGITPFVVNGVAFPGGVKSGDVATVLRYVATQFDKRVERLKAPGCWGYSYRKNRNADNLSCHASGTAIDCNAPAHPNGTSASHSFSAKQIDEIAKILAEVDHVVAWGGAFHGTPDPMHFEIRGSAAEVAAVARKLVKPVPKPTRGPHLDAVEAQLLLAKRAPRRVKAMLRILRSIPYVKG